MNKNLNILGIDIGGTKIYAGKYHGETLKLLDERHFSTDTHHSKETLLQEIISIVDSLRDHNTSGIGISFAGMIDKRSHIISRAPNIPLLDNTDLKTIISEHTKLPTLLENDAALFTYAQALIGNGKNKNPVLGITFGTGVGGGLVVDGKIYEGHGGWRMEPGHILPLCPHEGTEFEKEFGLEGWYSYIEKSTGKKAPKYFQEAYTTWDRNTASLFLPRVKILARFFTNLILLFNPEIIILGGGVGKYLMPLLLPHIKEEIQTHFTHTHYPLSTEIRCTNLENAGAIGAALAIKHRLKNK